MKETILFAPGANGAELLRSLARFGRNTLGYRVVGSVELARIALLRSGIAITDVFLPRKDEPSVIDSFLREIPYFENASFSDAESMASAFNSLRSLLPKDEGKEIHTLLSIGEFPEKNKALVSAYDRYMDKLTEAGKIDTIGLIRKALSEAEAIDADILTLKEYPLSPLENALAEKLSGGKV